MGFASRRETVNVAKRIIRRKRQMEAAGAVMSDFHALAELLICETARVTDHVRSTLFLP
jgi:hypothetical protein